MSMKENFGMSGSVHQRFKGKIRPYGGVHDTGEKNIPSEHRGPQQGAGKTSKPAGARQFIDKG